MKKYRILLSTLFAAGLLAVSCDDYVDINDDPNSPISEVVPPNLSLSGALTQPYRSFVGSDQSMNTLGNLFMNSFAGNTNQFTGIYVTESSLDIDTNFYSRIWENTYLTTLAYTDIINYDSQNFDNHKAIAKIMKTFYFQYLVDLYGDIPYSEAHDVSNPTPKYDDDQQIYRDLYTQLDEAIALINSADVSDATVGGEDAVFGGDMTAWTRFANTLKLRLLIRESGVAGSQAYITDKFNNDLASADFVTEDVTVNPGYSNGSNAQQNPFYNGYGFEVDDVTPRSGRQSTVASEHAINFLTGNLPQYGVTVPDPRVNTIFDTSEVTAGIPQGVPGDVAPDEYSLLGPGLIKGSDQDGYYMLAAESYLLQCEAVWRGYMTGDAEALYQAAIRASFATLGNSAAQADSYIGAIAGTEQDFASASNKLRAIMQQKYVALLGINGIESWIEYTRTGYPETPLAFGAVKPAKPKRLMYPSSEYSANSANVPNQSQADAFSTGPFWAQ